MIMTPVLLHGLSFSHVGVISTVYVRSTPLELALVFTGDLIVLYQIPFVNTICLYSSHTPSKLGLQSQHSGATES